MSVRSGDGCKIKPAPPSSNRQYVRNFTCTITKTPGVLPVMPAAPRIATMRNGDTLSLFSIDGCKLKPAAPTSGRQYMRNYTCTGGSTPPPARASLRSG